MQVSAQNEVERQIVRVMQEMTSLLILKNRDYGSASLTEGVIGNVVHLQDKIMRYKNMVYKTIRDREYRPNHESILDTLRDIIGFSVLGILVYNDSKRRGLDFLGLEVREVVRKKH